MKKKKDSFNIALPIAIILAYFFFIGAATSIGTYYSFKNHSYSHGYIDHFDLCKGETLTKILNIFNYNDSCKEIGYLLAPISFILIWIMFSAKDLLSIDIKNEAIENIIIITSMLLSIILIYVTIRFVFA